MEEKIELSNPNEQEIEQGYKWVLYHFNGIATKNKYVIILESLKILFWGSLVLMTCYSGLFETNTNISIQNQIILITLGTVLTTSLGVYIGMRKKKKWLELTFNERAVEYIPKVKQSLKASYSKQLSDAINNGDKISTVEIIKFIEEEKRAASLGPRHKFSPVNIPTYLAG